MHDSKDKSQYRTENTANEEGISNDNSEYIVVRSDRQGAIDHDQAMRLVYRSELTGPSVNKYSNDKTEIAGALM